MDESTKRLHDWCGTIHDRLRHLDAGRAQVPNLPPGGAPELRLHALRRLLGALDIAIDPDPAKRAAAAGAFAEDRPHSLGSAVGAALEEAAGLIAAGVE